MLLRMLGLKLPGAVWMGGEFGTCEYMAEFLLSSPETVTTLLNDYTLIQFFF